MEEENYEPGKDYLLKNIRSEKPDKKENKNWNKEDNDEAELSVDVYQTPTDIIVQTMVAGVKPEELELSIARDAVTIKGKREESRTIDEENYFTKRAVLGKIFPIDFPSRRSGTGRSGSDRTPRPDHHQNQKS